MSAPKPTARCPRCEKVVTALPDGDGWRLARHIGRCERFQFRAGTCAGAPITADAVLSQIALDAAVATSVVERAPERTAEANAEHRAALERIGADVDAAKATLAGLERLARKVRS